MTDHTPSPATDAEEPIETGWYAYSGGAQAMIFHLRATPGGGQWSAHFDNGTAGDCSWGYIEQALGVWVLVPLAPRALLTRRALLADPAPEAEQRADHFEHLYQQASEGRCGHSGLAISACKASICDCFEFPWVKSESPGHDCATCEDCIHDGRRCCGCYDGSCCMPTAPADLPVATGVATEDEGCECVGYTIRTDYGTGVEYDVDRSSCPLHPAPAPVVSAGDEGEGLSEEERQQLVDAGLGRKFRMNALQMATVERILAARVAEAGARALREAAERASWMTYPASQDPAHWAKWLRERADEIGGAS